MVGIIALNSVVIIEITYSTVLSPKGEGYLLLQNTFFFS